ncbi:hypothetical protein SEUCBS139899_007840 [Sporothrix eucalyptigena]|uniref:Zn(2)-C6 fungal-type domain-containing protein n=1 Tax=Sporothrix eucalyptigena TaxID=1812306 RepID=A0ABP0AS09_9PEZI
MANKSISNYTSVFRVRLGDDSNSKANSSGNGDTEDLTQQSQSQQQRSGSTNSTAAPPIRRSQPRAKARPVVSCHLCRVRKQKCDRLLPCGTCARRGDSALCRYGSEGGVSGVNGAPSASLTSPTGSTNTDVGSPGPSGTGRRLTSSAQATARAGGSGGPTGSALGVRQEAQMRLQRLEEMVNSLVSRAPTNQDKQTTEKDGTSIAKTPALAFGDPDPRVTGEWQETGGKDEHAPRFEWIMPIGPDAPSSAIGPVATILGQTPFSGGTNWAAVLDSIRDIQSYLGEAAAGDKGHKDAEEEGEEDQEDNAEDEDADEDMVEDEENSTEEPPPSRPAENPFHNFVDRPQMYGGVTDRKTALLPASLSSIPAALRAPGFDTTKRTALPTHDSSPASERSSLPPYRSFQLAEPDGIFSAIAAAPGLSASDQSIPPATSNLALSPPLPKHLADAIASLPPRSDCDRLIAVYFQSNYMTGPFVHTGQFQRSYSRFWRTGNPAAANPISPLLWISMLASILSMGAMIDGGRQLAWMADRELGQSHQAEHGDGSGGNGTGSGNKRGRDPDTELSNEDLKLASRLRQLSTRCLLAGDYLAGRPLAVEALVLNAHVRLMQNRDSDATQWATFGVIVRLAQRMGYHQVDAPGGDVCGIGGRKLTAFEKEMRRRVWYFVESFDMLFSFQFGMPTVVHEDEVATEPPRNLRDDDFDEATDELPPSRPPADYTTALYFTVKLTLIRLLRRVMRVAVWRTDKFKNLDTQSYKATVTRITQELRWTYTTLPARLRMPMHIRDCPFDDASHDIMHRLATEMMHHKAVCILFRESLSRDTSGDGGVDKSGFTAAETEMQRKSCLVSALRILDLHTEFEYETRPASTAAMAGGQKTGPARPGGHRGVGRLATDRHMLSSLALHDFLLAATILCLDLIEGGRNDQGSSKTTNSSKSGQASNVASNDTAAGTSSTTTAPSSTKNLELPPSLVFEPFLGGGGSSLEERAADRSAKIEALRTAYALWHERRLTSRDAAHAARILGAIVTKLSAEVGGEGNEYDVTGNKVHADNNSPGWGNWDIAARQKRQEMYEEDLRRQRAERAERAERAGRTTDPSTSSQSDTSRPRDSSSTPNQTHTPASQTTTTTTTTDSLPSGMHSLQGYAQQQQQLPQEQQQFPLPPAPMIQPPPPHLNYAYEWAEPGPFGAVLNDPMNVDWNMVDSFLLDRQLDIDVGGNVWSAELMALEN